MSALHHKKEGGYILLISVMILGTAAVAIILVLLVIGVEDNLDSGNYYAGRSAHMFATNCMETALEKLKENVNYAGNETLSFPKGETCTILTIQGSGNTNRKIMTQSNVNGAIQKVQVTVATVSPQIILSRWEEVVDFY